MFCAVEPSSLPSLAVEVNLEATTRNEVTSALSHKNDVLSALILHGVGSVTVPSTGNPSQLDSDRCLCSDVTLTAKFGSGKADFDFAIGRRLIRVSTDTHRVFAGTWPGFPRPSIP